MLHRRGSDLDQRVVAFGPTAGLEQRDPVASRLSCLVAAIANFGRAVLPVTKLVNFRLLRILLRISRTVQLAPYSVRAGRLLRCAIGAESLLPAPKRAPMPIRLR